MKLNATLAIGATIAAAAMFAACGGGSDAANDKTGQSSSKITTQHGLAVAALYGNGGDLPAAAPAEQDSTSNNTTSNSASTTSNSASARNVGGSTADSAGVVGAPQAVGDGSQGITVSGFGLATADPDTAIIDLYFSRYSYCCIEPQPAPLPPTDANGSSGSGIAPDIKPTIGTGEPVEPITEADIQPVIDALVGAGIARSDITFTGQTYFDQYSASATLHATVKNLDGVQNALTAAQNAAANIANTNMNSSVSYTLNDCSAIEKAALDAAVTDAGERGQQLADALGVSKGNIIGASDFSWSPSGSQCSSYGMPYPVAYDTISRDASGTIGGSNTVQVVAQISVTYQLN